MDFFTILEIVAVVFSLMGVYLTAKQKIWCYPVGILSVAVYVYIFFKVNLYSDAIENIIYIFMLIYGWYFWIYGSTRRNKLPVRRATRMEVYFWAAVILVLSLSMGFIMQNFTNASFPYMDATTTVASLVAQYFIAKKIIENWLMWIAIDLVGVVIYFSKSLYLTSGLYAFFLILAVVGWFNWQKSMSIKN